MRNNPELRRSAGQFLLIAQCSQPKSHMLAKRLYVDAAETGWAPAETPHRACKQGNGADTVSTAEMVKGSGDLHQRLQKALLRLREREPDKLPVFVRLEELPCAVTVQPLGQRARLPIKVCTHREENSEAAEWISGL